jgi:hypothetical protein
MKLLFIFWIDIPMDIISYTTSHLTTNDYYNIDYKYSNNDWIWIHIYHSIETLVEWFDDFEYYYYSE